MDLRNGIVAKKELLEREGRKVVERTIRTGERVLAATPTQIRELGLAAVTGQLPQVVAKVAAKEVVKRAAPVKKSASPASAKPAAPQKRTIASEAGPQARAAVSGAVDEFTFGLADKALAARDSIAAGGFDGFGDRYQEAIAKKQEADDHDERNYGAARGAGRAVGFAGSLMATGGFGVGGQVARAFPSAVKAVSIVRRRVPLTLGGLTAMAGGGGAVAGAAGQAVSDVLTRQRSSFGDYASAAVGGAVGGLATRIRFPGGGTALANKFLHDSRTTGAIEAGVTAVLQDSLNGDPITLNGVAQATRSGAIGGRVGDLAGKYLSNALPGQRQIGGGRTRSISKESLGEQLSVIKSIASGDGVPWGRKLPDFERHLPGVPAPGQQVNLPPELGGSRVDHITDKAIAVEGKFGPYAKHTPAQLRTLRALPRDRYRRDFWLPRDIGRANGLLFASSAAHLTTPDVESQR